MKHPLNIVNPSPETCVKCKGRMWCGPKCYVLEKYSVYEKTASQFKGTSFEGSSPPGFFVSHYSYPKVNVAPMSPTEHLKNASILDDSDKWFGMSEDKIISFRQQLVRSNSQFEVNSASDPSRNLMDIQELVMAKDATDVNIELKKKPRFDISFSDTAAPMGPTGELKKFSLDSNPSVDKKVDYMVSDVDVKSNVAMRELFEYGIGVNQLHKLLSAGLLGVKKSRRLTPTRWSIVAVDDSLSKYLLDSIKYYSQVDEVQLFSASYLGNNFHILIYPGSWCFEQLEAWFPGGVWTEQAKEPNITSDHEFYTGKKGYAENVTGAYYSARLAICEYLEKIKRQASVIVFREITPEYKLALGVWVIRNSVRDAMSSKPITFGDLSLALDYLGKKLNIPIKYWQKESKLLDDVKNQKRLFDFV